MTYIDALHKAQGYIAELNKTGQHELVLIDDATSEHSCGWIFRYNSKRFIETGDFGDRVVGAPILVDKRDGSVHVTATANLAGWLEHYERTGEPPLPPTGWTRLS